MNNLEVRLEIDGRSLETQRVSVSPGAPASVTFQPFTLARPFTRGTVRVGDDPLKQDDAFHFVVSPAQRLPVLLVVEPGRASEASLFLTRALSIGTTPTFQVDTRQAESVASADLERARVVILNDIGRAELRDGAHPLRGAGRWPVRRPRRARHLGHRRERSATGIAGQRRRLATGRGGSLAELDYSHPVLEVFKAPRSGNLSTARFFRYRGGQKPEPAGDKEGEHRPNNRVIARFDDGTIAIAERKIGSASHDLVVHARQLLERPRLKPVYLRSSTKSFGIWRRTRAGELVHHRTSRRPGHLLRASGLGCRAAPAPMVLTPSGQRIEQSGRPRRFSSAVRLLRCAGARPAGAVVSPRTSTRSSPTSPARHAELSAALAGRPGTVNPAAADAATLTPEDQERRQILVVSA